MLLLGSTTAPRLHVRLPRMPKVTSSTPSSRPSGTSSRRHAATDASTLRTPGPAPFPAKFTWGVAAAAPQIEGAATEDGKGVSVWDTFARTPGRVAGGDTLDVACDHYHRFDEDFRLMAKLGFRHYRLSIAWPRIFPNGHGSANPRGLDFYRRLFASMRKHGITPWVTLFHWDLPQPLEDAGGWCNRATVDAFARYADTVVAAFRRDVKRWFTINEIPCFTRLAHTGAMDKAPGYPLPARDLNQAIHHALLAHAHGVRAVREHGARGSIVGAAEVPDGFVPLTETPEDIAASRQAFEDHNDQILGTPLLGEYTPRLMRRLGRDRPVVARGDLEMIALPADFTGVNVYTAHIVRAGGRRGYEVLPFPAKYPQAARTGWLKPVPQSIYWTTRHLAECYGPRRILITENGYGTEETPAPNGEILDLHRRDYLRQHLLELRRAIADGVPVDGYFAWSFMDNFEWADGYTIRFGLCHTDYATQRRTPKLSALWYSRVVRENRVV